MRHDSSRTAERAPSSVSQVHALDWPPPVWNLLLTPPHIRRGRDDARARGILAERFGLEGLTCLAPLMVVDEASFACVVIRPFEGCSADVGAVVRVFQEDVHSGDLALLDVDPLLYVESVAEELDARKVGLKRVLDQIGPAYEETHLSREKRPRGFVVRPVRIACQNVIVALGAIAQDSSFDGLSVPAWQTCEVPHVATHEGNRALAALTLCDAFQGGGTMEIRFDRTARIIHEGKRLTYAGHPEMAVPASLRRFGRTVGVSLGGEDPGSISPREARDLFLAITPMPDALRARVNDAVDHRGMTPERICYLLLSQVWREIEMDYLLATTSRAPSILRGGADWTDRAARQAESENCRGAVTVGMLFRRLNTTDRAGPVRVVEDPTPLVRWTVIPEAAAVTFVGIDAAEPLPWTFGTSGVNTLTVFPRSTLTPDIIGEVTDTDAPGVKAVLVPADAPAPSQPHALTVLRSPDRLADIDKSIEGRLLESRISRG